MQALNPDRPDRLRRLTREWGAERPSPSQRDCWIVDQGKWLLEHVARDLTLTVGSLYFEHGRARVELRTVTLPDETDVLTLCRRVAFDSQDAAGHYHTSLLYQPAD